MLFNTSTESRSWASSAFTPLILVHYIYGIMKSIVVEFAKESRPRRDPYEDRGSHGYERRFPTWES
jgi:hypothetical protein